MLLKGVQKSLADDATRWSNAECMSAHVDRSEGGSPSPTPTNQKLPKPYLKADGTLVIPMLCDPKYHYWKKGGQSLYKTLEELRRNDGVEGRGRVPGGTAAVPLAPALTGETQGTSMTT